MPLFIFFYSIISIDTFDGRYDQRLENINPNKIISIENSIFIHFHCASYLTGAAIYIYNPNFDIQLSYDGFSDCTTNSNCGAFYLFGRIILLNYLCGTFCEASQNCSQFFEVRSDMSQSSITHLAVSFCGANNGGYSAICFTGNTEYKVSYINSSSNYNFLNDIESHGACFRTNSKYEVSFFNFLYSTGLDVIYLEDDTTGSLNFGNILNCTAKYIVLYKGINTIKNAFLGNLIYDEPFEVDSNMPGHSLSFFTCMFDKQISSQKANFSADCIFNSPIQTKYLQNEDFSKCEVPSDSFVLEIESSEFTQSNLFTKSLEFLASKIFSFSLEFSESNLFSSSVCFTKSNVFSSSAYFEKSNVFTPSFYFTKSSLFSPSIRFTKSNLFAKSSFFSSSILFSKSDCFTISKAFSESNKFLPSTTFTQSNSFSNSFTFTKSNSFSQIDKVSLSSSNIFLINTNTFSSSNTFTPSFTFSPNATKYPDGLNNVIVTGRNFFHGKATKTEIAATAGISFTIIGVSIFLMILYIRNKHKNLHRKFDDLSDAFLYDSTDQQSSSYSYSYYTYEYCDTSSHGEEFSEVSYNEINSTSEYSYTDFDSGEVLYHNHIF